MAAAPRKIRAQEHLKVAAMLMIEGDCTAVAAAAQLSLQSYEEAEAHSIMGELYLRGQNHTAGIEALPSLIKAVKMAPLCAIHRVQLIKAYLIHRDFPRARLCAADAVSQLFSDDPCLYRIRLLLRHLEDAGVPDQVSNTARATLEQDLTAAPRTLQCAYCQCFIPASVEGQCPLCACDPRGRGVGVHPWMDERLAPFLKHNSKVAAPRQCWTCGAIFKTLSRCRHCKVSEYCSTDCQQKGWLRLHRFECHSKQAQIYTIVLPPDIEELAGVTAGNTSIK